MPRALAVLAGAGVTMTLMACYGAPGYVMRPADPPPETSASSAPLATEPPPGDNTTPTTPTK